MSKPKAKACPFACGFDRGVMVITASNKLHSVSCQCGARGPVAKTLKAAIQGWNQRAQEIRTNPEPRGRYEADEAIRLDRAGRVR